MEDMIEHQQTLDDLLDLYVMARSIGAKTVTRYQLAVRNLVLTLGRPSKVVRVDDLTLDQLVQHKQSTLKRTSAITWNTERQHLSCLFNFAVRLGWIAVNPIRLVSSVPVYKRKPKAVDRATMAAYIDLLSSATKISRYGNKVVDLLPPQWFWLTVLFTYYHTGIRRAQLVGLNWGDLDFDERSIQLRAETSKTKREWKVPITEALAPQLGRLLDETIKVLGRVPRADEQVFCLPLFSEWRVNFKSGRMVADNVDSFFKRLREAAPLMPRLSSHRVRHTTATVLANSVPNLKVVQELLGHTTIKTTYGYVHVNIEDMRRATELL